MRAQEIMTVDPACVTPDATIRDAVEIMKEHDCGAVPVIRAAKDRRLVGILTDRDVALHIFTSGSREPALVNQAMRAPVVTVTRETPVETCCHRMTDAQVRRLVVITEQGECIGVIAQADLARHLPAEEVGALVKRISEDSRTGLA